MSEVRLDQPAVQLLWLVDQASLTVPLARAFFDGKGEEGAVRPGG
jgi:hypothetical protein